MTLATKISYALMASLLLALVVFHMGHVLLAALFAFMLTGAAFKLLKPYFSPGMARRIAVAVFFVLLIVVSFVFLRFVKTTLVTLPTIMARALPQVTAIAQTYGVDLPFEDVQGLQELIHSKMMGNALAITKMSTSATREIFHIFIGIVAAALFFMSGKAPEYKNNLFDAVRAETNKRIRKFMASFEKVFGAQIVISAINTALTALFIYFIGMPHVIFLATMTFTIGIMPIVGNLVTNTVIVITALGMSLHAALFALVFLVSIHKLEYFLNSRIIGSNIDMPMWQMLMAIFVGDVMLGIPGIMLAPAILHYVKSELQAIPVNREQA
ncbi:MAG: AI-2E family transporter [Elusimicrobiales bacterium]